jgi:AraC-like DNA-binding protein
VDGGDGARIRLISQDTALGRWRMHVGYPRPALAAEVSQLWHVEGDIHYQRDRILPHPGSTLLINLGPTQYRIEPGSPERRIAFDDIWLSGLQQKPFDTEAPHGCVLFGIAFRAAGLRPWLHIDADECADHVLPLADLLGDSVLALRQRLLDCRSALERFPIVEEWLAARLEQRFQPSPLVCGILSRIESAQGNIGIQALARYAGVSRKALNERFQREVGIGGKALARIIRFKHATRCLGEGIQASWADLAADCGYYDQSHMIRDFRTFSGMAPGDFQRSAKPDEGSIVID